MSLPPGKLNKISANPTGMLIICKSLQFSPVLPISTEIINLEGECLQIFDQLLDVSAENIPVPYDCYELGSG